jgi:nitronate monooxygenase
MWPDNRLRDLLGIDIPIVQAPMAGSSSLQMAVAVSEAGGLGSLACAAQNAEELRRTLIQVRERTSKPLNVNFFAHSHPQSSSNADAVWLNRLSTFAEALGAELPAEISAGVILPFDDERCSIIEELPPAVVSFHFGLPEKELVNRIKATGAKITSSATTVAEARFLAEQGVDFIIAQGYEAGGHRGMFLTQDVHTQIGTLSLVPQVVDAVDVPVIAAGGIADGRGIAAAFALGASAFQIGTAFLLTEEATIDPIYRNALTSTKSAESALTNVFSGRPTRCVVNRAMRKLGPMANNAPAFPKGFTAMKPLRVMAEKAGRRDFSAHYCGQSAPLAKSTTAAGLVRNLAEEANLLLVSMADGARQPL